MDFELLEDFLAVLEHGSILSAAEARGTSQPTLSRKIRELEDSLGVLLLNRTSRGVSPTIYGATFKHRAEELLRNRHIALDEIRALKHGEHGHARIGLAPALAGYLPEVLSDIKQAKPGVTFEVVEGTYDVLVDRTLKGEIDGAFTMLPPGESTNLLAVRGLPEEPIVVVANAEHPILRAAPGALADEEWIVMNRPRSLVAGFIEIATELGLAKPRITIETSSLDFLKSMVKRSSLLSALPRGAVCRELSEGVLQPVDLPGLPSVQTAFVHRHGILPPLATEVFRAMAAHQARKSGAT